MVPEAPTQDLGRAIATVAAVVAEEVGVRIFWSVAVGAAVGGVTRYYLSAFIQQRTGLDFPLGTLVINVTGSFLLGFIMQCALQTTAFSTETRVLLTSGFCGGYTTFSTFSYETVRLLDEGETGRAALYVGASVALAVAGTFLGIAAANRLLALRAGT